MNEPDPTLTVAMPRSLWIALLGVEDAVQETYTNDGVAIFDAFQQVHEQTGIYPTSGPAAS